jgi:polyhydroxyalkanoate synthesis regulator phasin
MKNQKGIAQIILIAVVGVLIAGAVGYGYFSKKGLSGSKSGLSNFSLGGPILNSNCKYNDPNLCKYINRSLGADFYKNGLAGKSLTTDKSGKKSESVFEFQGNGNTHFISTSDGKEVWNIITIGNIRYAKDYTDNKWWKQVEENVKEGDSNMFDTKKMKEEIMKDFKEKEDKTEYRKVGEEPCGNLTCFKYQVINSQLKNTTQYIYFDNKEYLMRKMLLVEESYSSETEFSYGNIDIKEPSPVKEAKAGQNIFMPAISGNDNGGNTGSINSQETQTQIEELMKKYQTSPPPENTTETND